MKLIGVASKNFSKIGYVMFQLFWILIAFLTMLIGTWIVGWTTVFGINCPEQSGGGNECFTSSLFVRMSFALAVFQFAIFLIVLTRSHCAAVLHDGWWTLKFLFVAALYISSFWFSLEFITGYMKFARIFSVFYLSYQAIMMLIVSYVINHFFVSNVKNGAACSGGGIALISLFTILTLGNITMMVMMFVLFSGCGGNVAIMICTCVIAFILYGVVMFRLR